jgi:uncharacterized membrane protein
MTASALTRRGTDTRGLVLQASVVTNGLVAGIWYAYAVSVMIALGRVDDRTFVNVMNEIDDAIQNPVFFLGFLGSLVIPAVAVAQRWRERGPIFRWLVAGLVLSAVAFLVTIAFNVPLNNDLAEVASSSPASALAAARSDYEDPWVAGNIVRGLLQTGALICLGYALILHGRDQRA